MARSANQVTVSHAGLVFRGGQVGREVGWPMDFLADDGGDHDNDGEKKEC